MRYNKIIFRNKKHLVIGIIFGLLIFASFMFISANPNNQTDLETELNALQQGLFTHGFDWLLNSGGKF